jgi:hypothetical protein
MDNFIPECLIKDVKNVNEYISTDLKDNKFYKIELIEYNLEASETIFKDFIKLSEKYSFIKISENSDIVTLKLKSTSLLGFIETTKNVSIIRYWRAAKGYFIIRILEDDKKTLLKYIKIILVFPKLQSDPSHIRLIVRINEKNHKGLSYTVNQIIELILNYLKTSLANFIVFYKKKSNKRKTLMDLNTDQLKNFNRLKDKIETKLGYDIYTNDEIIRAMLFTNNNLDKSVEFLMNLNNILSRYYKANNELGISAPIVHMLGRDKEDNPVIVINSGLLKLNTFIDATFSNVIIAVKEVLELCTNKIAVIVDFGEFIVEAIGLLNDIVILIKTLAYSVDVVFYIKNYKEGVLKNFVEKGILINNNSINNYVEIIPKEFLL